MAKARSPAYPVIGLKEAIDKVSAVYRRDYQNLISKPVMAQHMGYFGLNGKSLGVLSALSKYGLIEGRGDNSRVTDLAVQIIAHQPGTPERATALREAASQPGLFAELDKRYPSGGSDEAIRAYLMTQKFIPQAADAAIRSYRETKDLVRAEGGAYDSSDNEQEAQVEAQTPRLEDIDPASIRIINPEPQSIQRRAVFDLSEGEVVITYPDDLSPESVSDLQDYINVFMKKARREAGVQ